jgi:hypothetical protein
MSLDFKQLLRRREFFRGVARYTILGGALILGRALTARPSSGENVRCVPSGVCQECAAFRQCNLPQATAARKL